MLDSAPLLESPRAVRTARPRHLRGLRGGLSRPTALPLRLWLSDILPTLQSRRGVIGKRGNIRFCFGHPPLRWGLVPYPKFISPTAAALCGAVAPPRVGCFVCPFMFRGYHSSKPNARSRAAPYRLPRPALRAFRLSARCVKRRACGARYPRACPPIPPALWGRAPRRAMGGRSLSKQGFFSGAVGLFVTCHRAPFVAVATFSCGYRSKTAATAAEIQPQAVKTARAAQKRVKDAPPPEF